jgi:putative salt-induced outer membrane protein YdiY
MFKFFIIFGLFFSGFGSYAFSQNTQTDMPIWQNPTPMFSQQFDWLKLTSDEWLKGDIISMYDDELEFDSDEFGVKSFDWDKVSELRSRFDQQIRLADGRIVQGFLIVKNGKLSLISEGTEQYFPLSDLLSITSAADARKDLWEAKVSLGVDVSSGNVNQIDYVVSAQAQRRTPINRLKADFIFNYNESTGNSEKIVNVNTRRLNTYFDWFYSPKLFFRVVEYENYSDLQQNIKVRHSVGTSLGYHFINTKRVEWDFNIGPSYLATHYTNTIGGDIETSAALSLSTLLEYQITSKIDFIIDYQMQFVGEESGERTYHTKTGFEFEFIDDLDIQLLFYLDRIAKPVSSSLDVTPEASDYRLVFSVGYTF